MREIRDLRRNQQTMARENSNLREQVHQLMRGSRPRASPTIYRTVEPPPSVGLSLGHSPPDEPPYPNYAARPNQKLLLKFPDLDRFSDGTPTEFI